MKKTKLPNKVVVIDTDCGLIARFWLFQHAEYFVAAMKKQFPLCGYRIEDRRGPIVREGDGI